MDSQLKSKEAVAELDYVLITPGSTKCSLEQNLKKGLGLYAAGRPHHALWAFSLVLEEDPAHILGHYLCGLALRSLDLPDEAKTEWYLAAALPVAQAQTSTAAWARQMAQSLLSAKYV